MYRRIINVRIIKPKEKTKYTKYITFASGSLLSISEIMPFYKETKSNGILHRIYNIANEWNKT
jgi:hypothetical protein